MQQAVPDDLLDNPQETQGAAEEATQEEMTKTMAMPMALTVTVSLNILRAMLISPDLQTVMIQTTTMMTTRATVVMEVKFRITY